MPSFLITMAVRGFSRHTIRFCCVEGWLKWNLPLPVVGRRQEAMGGVDVGFEPACH